MSREQSGREKKRKNAHQNTYAFKHNPGSVLTKKISQIPLVHLCKRCHDKMEWKKKYRKFKPMTHPSKCTGCLSVNVYHSYHILCDSCATSKGTICRVCKKPELYLPPQLCSSDHGVPRSL